MFPKHIDLLKSFKSSCISSMNDCFRLPFSQLKSNYSIQARWNDSISLEINKNLFRVNSRVDTFQNNVRSYSNNASSVANVSNESALEISYVPPAPIADLIQMKFLEGKTVLITGSTRGIGLAIAKKMAEAGANVIITGKSVEDKPNLPGTIYTAAEEVRRYATLKNQRVFATPLDITNEKSIEEMGDVIEKEFGTIDICINNAGALWWKNVAETPLKRLDLVMNVNFRGSFAVSRMLITRNIMKKGHFIMMSPPVDSWREFSSGKAAYSVSKLGMSILAYAITKEYPKQFVAFSVWPKTLIESYATINFKIGDKSQWRRADILADSCLLMATEPIETSENAGESWVDEDYLKCKGITDLKIYRCDPESEPSSMDFTSISRGKVTEV